MPIDGAASRSAAARPSTRSSPTAASRSAPARANRHAVRLDAAGEVDVLVEVAERERPRRREHRLPAVQARIARARDGAPACRRAVDEDHVIEQVDRLEAEDERRIAVLLEDHRRRQRRLEAVRGAGANDAAEASQRLAALFGVVRQRIEPPLHGRGRAQPRDDPALRPP